MVTPEDFIHRLQSKDYITCRDISDPEVKGLIQWCGGDESRL